MPLLLPLDIINAGCARIGADPMQSLDDETTTGQNAGLLYEELLGFALGVYQFSFARTIKQMSRLTDTVPLSGWTYVFQLPPERNGPPLYVTDDITNPDRRYSRYSLVEDTVHSDCDPLFAMIKFSAGPHLWSATFKTVVITGLASRLAMALASDRQTMESLYQEAFGRPEENGRGGQMRAAINEDAQATPPRKPDWDNNPLTRARSSS